MGYKIKGIYVGNQKVRPSGGGGWQPGANTLFYFPLISNANDISGNSRDGTTANVTFSSNGAYCIGGFSEGNNGTITTSTFTMGTTYTINLWVKAEQTLSGNHEIDFHRRWSGPARYVIFYVNTNGFTCILGNGSNQNGNSITASFSMGTSWHNICLTRSGSNVYIYADGTLLTSGNGTYAVDPEYFNIGNDPGSNAEYTASSYIKDYIMENQVRSAQDIADYYNQTKGNYGIS